MRTTGLLIPLVTVLVTGCATLTPQERRAQDEVTCRDYGFKPRTNAFAECLQRIDLSRDADRRAWRYDDPYFRGGIGIGGYYGRW